MDPPRHDEPTQQSARTLPLLCRICNKPVTIETARTDSDGKAVHGDCYVHEINDQRSSDGGLREQKRSWLVIAKELSQEQNPTKVTELAKELSKALNEKAALKAKTEKAPDSQG